MTLEESTDILRMCESPKDPRLLVLGSFANYVTLYSQQVRALNLIAALLNSGRLRSDDHLAVIGAGAAGLTAACAAAFHGVNVELLEELDGPVEIQRNNRQRWIHPHIYDWPNEEFKGEEANLPLLNWKADYAEKVSIQIQESFEDIQRATGKIRNHWAVSHLFVKPSNDSVTVTWTDTASHVRDFNTVVFAVGFGLEPHTEGQRSYWSEDDLDGSFRTSGEDERWLVSGYGDGAFTDLMRLCIHRFRHAEIARLFATAPGINGVIADLVRIHSDEHANDERFLSQAFEDLSTGGLEKILESRLRKRGPKVFLTGITPYRYGPKASVLNRLIVRLLAELGRFSYIPGPIKNIEWRGKDYEVSFEEGSEVFDRVVRRHGPEPKLKNAFPAVWSSCQPLMKEWKKLSREADRTRCRLWAPNYFGPEVASAGRDDVMDREFAAAVERIGVYATALKVYKQLRSDGSSTLTYEIEGLSVIKGSLSGLCFYFESSLGSVNLPELNAAAKRAGVEWDSAEYPYPPYEVFPDLAPMEQARNQARRICRVLKFPQAFGSDSEPLTFGVTLTVLNGDALTSWEFEQFYAPEERKHFNGEPLEQAIEYIARTVWFPVETLQLTITLPREIGAGPTPSLFVLDDKAVPREAVVRDSVLLFFPSADSNWNPLRTHWKKQSIRSLQTPKFINSSDQTWELSIQKPRVGSCYTLDWTLPTPTHDREFSRLERESRQFRLRLMDRAKKRRGGVLSTDEFVAAFQKFANDVAAEFALPGEPAFHVSMMTYNEADRRMSVVEGTVNGKEPEPAFWDFWLPFGLGLAGACYKQGDRAFIYLAQPEAAPEAPDFYLVIPGLKPHSFMISLPVDHPDFTEGRELERSRQCVGVINIASGNRDTRLLDLITAEGKIPALWEKCQDLCDVAFASFRQ